MLDHHSGDHVNGMPPTITKQNLGKTVAFPVLPLVAVLFGTLDLLGFFSTSHCAAQMPHIVVLLFAKFLWKNHP